VTVVIASGVVTADCAYVIDASSLGKILCIVRFDDRRAKVTIAEPDETARRAERVDVKANDVASVVNLLRLGRNYGSGIIESRDYVDRD
jgi:hypothetical protein